MTVLYPIEQIKIGSQIISASSTVINNIVLNTNGIQITQPSFTALSILQDQTSGIMTINKDIDLLDYSITNCNSIDENTGQNLSLGNSSGEIAVLSNTTFNKKLQMGTDQYITPYSSITLTPLPILGQIGYIYPITTPFVTGAVIQGGETTYASVVVPTGGVFMVCGTIGWTTTNLQLKLIEMNVRAESGATSYANKVPRGTIHDTGVNTVKSLTGTLNVNGVLTTKGGYTFNFKGYCNRSGGGLITVNASTSNFYVVRVG